MLKTSPNSEPRNLCGTQIRKIRRAKEITQVELAAKMQAYGLNTPSNVIIRIESRKRVVSDYELVILSQILQVPITELLPTTLVSTKTVKVRGVDSTFKPRNLCGTQIRKIRRAKEITQVELAARMQICGLNAPENVISRIESGERIATDNELFVISKILKVPLTELLDSSLIPTPEFFDD